MKINRSSKLSLKFLTSSKQETLNRVLDEYARVVNAFIDLFWDECPRKADLLKPVVDSVPSWFSARLRKVAAREAIDMVKSASRKTGKRGGKPMHNGKRMCVSSTIAALKEPKHASEFDAWIHLASIGGGVILDLPIRYHKHYHSMAARGRRMESYVITRSTVQFCFEIETGPKREPKTAVGVDTGIKALASLSTGEQLGTDINDLINKSKRKKWGSKGHKRALRSLRQRIDEVARDIAETADVLVVEDLLGITHKTRRRLGKEMRRSVGVWNVRYWMSRLQARTEDSRTAFRRVPSQYTSQCCSKCGHTERGNRNGEMFVCRACGHTDNADVQASHNILSRFLTGPYGAGCKPAALTYVNTA